MEPLPPADDPENEVDDLEPGIGVEACGDKENQEESIIGEADREVEDADADGEPDAPQPGKKPEELCSRYVIRPHHEEHVVEWGPARSERVAIGSPWVVTLTITSQ